MFRFLEIAIFFGFIIVMLSVLAWRFYFGPLAKQQLTNGAKTTSVWNETLNAVAKIRSEWIEYETTDNFLLDLPSLTNREIPEVDAYHKMMLRLSVEYPHIDELYKMSPDPETLDFLLRIIEAHSKAKSRAKKLDS